MPRLARIVFGLNRSVRAVGDDHRIDAGRVGTAQNRAQVARLFDSFEHGHQRLRRQSQIVEPPTRRLGHDDDSDLVAVAERQTFAYTSGDTGSNSAPAGRSDSQHSLAVRLAFAQVFADERLDRADAASIARMISRAPSMMNRPCRSPPAAGPQPHRVLHARILPAGDARWCRHDRIRVSRFPFIHCNAKVDSAAGWAPRMFKAMHVFTYGTLMFPEVWQAVVGRPFDTVGGHAAGFAIYRVRDAVFPGIIAAAAKDCVRGVVYLDVDDDSVARLDRFEDDFYGGNGFWSRATMAGHCEAEAYVVPAEHRGVLTDEPWDRDDFVARGDLQRFIEKFAGFQRL